MPPAVSIIIVAYKSRDEIGSCLASLPRTLGGRPVEVIVVDNSGDSDGTGERVRNACPWATYLNPGSNLGFGRANNLGFARSTGEYVLFLNPDTVANEEALAHCLARLEADSTIGLISPKLVQADGTMDLACRRSIPTAWDGFCRATGLAAAFPRTALFAGYNLTHLPEDGTYDVGAINGAFMLAPRAALAGAMRRGRTEEGGRRREEGGGRREKGETAVFDEAFFMYGDDLDLCIRVAQAGYRIVYDGRVSITHLKGVSVGKDFDSMAVAIFDANRDVYLKHFGRGRIRRLGYLAMFGLWRSVALLRARLRGHRKVRPV